MRRLLLASLALLLQAATGCVTMKATELIEPASEWTQTVKVERLESIEVVRSPEGFAVDLRATFDAGESGWFIGLVKDKETYAEAELVEDRTEYAPARGARDADAEKSAYLHGGGVGIRVAGRGVVLSPSRRKSNSGDRALSIVGFALLVPFTVALDVATLPFQGIGLLVLMNADFSRIH